MKNLFNYDDPPKKVITYASLNIHQKINYRANQGNAFYGTIFKSRFYYYTKPLFKPVTDRLTRKYWIEYRWNAGGNNRLDNYLKAKNPNLFT